MRLRRPCYDCGDYFPRYGKYGRFCDYCKVRRREIAVDKMRYNAKKKKEERLIHEREG